MPTETPDRGKVGFSRFKELRDVEHDARAGKITPMLAEDGLEKLKGNGNFRGFMVRLGYKFRNEVEEFNPDKFEEALDKTGWVNPDTKKAFEEPPKRKAFAFDVDALEVE